MPNLNLTIFRFINGGPDAIQPLMSFFSQGINLWPVRILLLVSVILLIRKGGPARLAAIQALIAFPIANFSTDLLKAFAAAPRPCNELADVLAHGIGCSSSMGTASAHSANMAAVAFVFVYHLKEKGLPWVVVALITGLSRVYHGAHYPSQVVLGWTCGVLVAFLVTTIGSRILRGRSAVEPLTHTDESVQP